MAGKSIDITGNIIRIKLSSDNGGNEYGFKIDSIIAIPETEKPTKGNIDSNNSTTKITTTKTQVIITQIIAKNLMEPMVLKK